MVKVLNLFFCCYPGVGLTRVKAITPGKLPRRCMKQKIERCSHEPTKVGKIERLWREGLLGCSLNLFT
jgi:hypothetical protein